MSRMLAVCLAAAVLIVGCRSESKSRKETRSQKGTVTKTDLANNKVSMKIKKERDGNEVEITGSLTPETEVFINGLKRTPADVEINDEVRVEYERAGDGIEMQFTVTRVEVSRPEGWKSTKPATTQEIKILPPQPEAPNKADRTFIVPPKPEGATTTPPPAPTPGATPAATGQNAEATTNQIYGLIREKMNEAVTKRAALLKAGKAANDPEVVHEEGIIRKARSLLMERGENVEPLVPPLPEDSAAPAGAAQASKPAAAGS